MRSTILILPSPKETTLGPTYQEAQNKRTEQEIKLLQLKKLLELTAYKLLILKTINYFLRTTTLLPSTDSITTFTSLSMKLPSLKAKTLSLPTLIHPEGCKSVSVMLLHQPIFPNQNLRHSHLLLLNIRRG